MIVSWLSNAVCYEIYSQSLDDSDGDLKGIPQKLDYAKSPGCNALWLNPIYDLIFQDAAMMSVTTRRWHNAMARRRHRCPSGTISSPL